MSEIYLLECKCNDKISIDNFNINEKILNYITKNWSQYRVQMRKNEKLNFHFSLIILYAYKINTSN